MRNWILAGLALSTCLGCTDELPVSPITQKKLPELHKTDLHDGDMIVGGLWPLSRKAARRRTYSVHPGTCKRTSDYRAAIRVQEEKVVGSKPVAPISRLIRCLSRIIPKRLPTIAPHALLRVRQWTTGQDCSMDPCGSREARYSAWSTDPA
jgi:hypothetical protein